MDPVAEQVAQCMVHRPLPLDPAHPRELRSDDLDREVAFAAPVMPRMAEMLGAVVDHVEMRRSERIGQAFGDFRGERAGETVCHQAYIVLLHVSRRAVDVASAGSRFHGRVEGRAARCAWPGCEAPGEFRAPSGRRPDFDGPGDWRWLCLDHVRQFNAGYNYFSGMSSDEIEAAQNPYGGWDRETRAFATGGGDVPPRWSDFTDPLDAIGARFRRPVPEAQRGDGRELSGEDRKSLKILGLAPDADRRGLRMRYAELLRRYHPDHNGGDRTHEKALQAVIQAYTQLKSRPAFA